MSLNANLISVVAFVFTRGEYYVYIVTNIKKNVLYVGLTNDLKQRIVEHFLDSGNEKTFTGKYNAFYLIYFESSRYINNMIAREKEIKNWRRSKKEDLIKKFNPGWIFLNERLFGVWPPKFLKHRNKKMN